MYAIRSYYVGIDIDPVRVHMARANAAALRANAEFIQADVTHLPLNLTADDRQDELLEHAHRITRSACRRP